MFWSTLGVASRCLLFTLMSRCRVLKLQRNAFSGVLPQSALNSLGSLVSVNVAYNFLTQPVPSTMASHVGANGIYAGNCYSQYPPVRYACDYFRLGNSGEEQCAALMLHLPSRVRLRDFE